MVRILYIDDDDLDIYSFLRYFDKIHKVTCVKEASEFLELYDNNNFDFVILDQNMYVKGSMLFNLIRDKTKSFICIVSNVDNDTLKKELALCKCHPDAVLEKDWEKLLYFINSKKDEEWKTVGKNGASLS